MLLEFLYEFFSDLSPFYIYLSVLLSMIFALGLMPFFTESFVENDKLYRRNLHAKRAKLIQMQEPRIVLLEKKNWLTRKTNRIESPDDDDTDSDSFLFLIKIKKQGGTQWKNNLYSRSLRSLALSGYSS